MCVPVGAQVLGAVKALEWDQRAHAHRSVSAQAIRDELRKVCLSLSRGSRSRSRGLADDA